MYQTRIDENGEHGCNAKAAAAKAAASGANDHNAKAASMINNRRALGDIGNIVAGGASRHRQLVADGGKKAVLPAAAVDRPITRSYGALLAARSQQQDAAGASCSLQPNNGVAQELPHRKNSSRPATLTTSTAANVAATGKTRFKGRTLTATLNARSEAVSSGAPIAVPTAKLPNIDAEDEGNQLAAVDYVEHMYSFYRKTEAQSCVPADYMSRQSDINHKMRSILVNWLVEVHFKFKLMHETLFLTTNVMDRFLSTQMGIDRGNLQLVGITALLIASKYEEIWAPQISDLIYISDSAYTREQILDMEKAMLNILRFNLCVPTPYMFVARFLKAAQSGAIEKLRHLAFYYVELSLVSYDMLKYSPSMLAAAAVYAAQNTLRRIDAATVDASPCWSALLRHHSGYAESQLLECARTMVSLHVKSREGQLIAVSRKYALEKYESVALMRPPII